MIKNKLFLCLLATMVAIFSVCIMQAGTVQTMRTAKSSVKTEPDGKKKKKTANKSDDGSTVTLITTGTGSTKEEATKNALRDALEQTYGTFVSANTLVINDKLIKDEIVSISSGNIVEYDVVSFIDSKPMIVTVEAVVSISNLITYAQNKGMEAELAGNTFVMNMRLEELNRESQKKAIENLIQQAKLMSKNLFDYEIKIGEPERVRNKAVVGIDILVKPNPNALSLYDLIHSTLRKLSQMVYDSDSDGNLIKAEYDFSRYNSDRLYPTISFTGSWTERVRNDPYRTIKNSHFIGYVLKERIEEDAYGYEREYWRDVDKRLRDNLDSSSWGFEIIDNLGNTYRHDRDGRDDRLSLLDVNSTNWLGLPRYVLETKDIELYKYQFNLYYTMDEISKIKKIEVRPKNPL